MPNSIAKKIDFDVFICLWNTLQKHSTPDIHFRMARWLQECWSHGDRRLLLTAFRASGKSTLAALFSAWVLYRDPDLRILVLSAEGSLASKMVRNIRNVIRTNPLTVRLIPHKADQWSSDRFTINRPKELRDPSVLGRGITSNITGARADLIICDDVEVPNTCDTADKRAALRERLAECEYILTPGGTMLYIGTPHTYHSIYTDEDPDTPDRENIFLKGYKRFSLPLLKDCGRSVWPERYTVSDIERIRMQTGPNKFASQMMLQLVDIEDSRLDPGLLRFYSDDIEAREVQKNLYLSLAGRRLVSCSAWWDPAFGSATGDSSVLAIVFTDEAGDYWLHHVEYICPDVESELDEATLQCRDVTRMAAKFYVPSIVIETNGIGKFLPAILRRELAAARVPCAVVEKASVKPKDIRILESFDVPLAARALHVHERVRSTPFLQEMREWRPGLRAARDDGLDAVAGALSLEPVRLRRTYFPGRANWQTTETS